MAKIAYTPAPDLGACPHCGGKSGLTAKWILSAVRVERWDGNDAATDDLKFMKESNLRCVDCKCRVTREQIKEMQASRGLRAPE